MNCRAAIAVMLVAFVTGCPKNQTHPAVDAGTNPRDASVDGASMQDASMHVDPDGGTGCSASNPCSEGTCTGGQCVLSDVTIGSFQATGSVTSDGTTQATTVIGSASMGVGVSRNASGTIEHIGGFVPAQ